MMSGILRREILARNAIPRGMTGITSWGARHIHSTEALMEKQSYLKRIRRIQKHVASQMLKPKVDPGDPVLGKPQTPFLERIKARISEEFNQVGNLDPENTDNLLYGAERAALLRSGTHAAPVISSIEAEKREALQRIISMKNASQAQIKKFAISLAMEEFQRFEGDTGSSEVQAAVATIKIQYLANHLKENIHDYHSQKILQELVQGRQAILRYLKRSNPQRYFWAIEKLGLTDTAAVGEFSLSRKYFEKVQFFGDKTLPVRIKKPEMRRIRRAEVLKKRAKKYLADKKAEADKAAEEASILEQARAARAARAAANAQESQ